MNFSDIRPFVRYVHYLPLDYNSEYYETVPYDNRLFFTYYGNGKISVNEKIYTAKKGSLLIIPSGVKYRLLPPKGNVTYIAVNFDYTSKNSHKQNPIPPTIVSAYNPCMQVEQIDFVDMPCFNNTLFLENLFSLNGVFLKIYNEYSHKTLFYENVISNLFSEILFQCARMTFTKDFKEQSETINEIIDYINENYNKKITNEIIGKRFNLHPNYVSSLFKKFTGIPLHQFVLQKQISVSAEMLTSKKHSISEIAIKCGFSDVYHFSKSFKKAVGISPSKYN